MLRLLLSNGANCYKNMADYKLKIQRFRTNDLIDNGGKQFEMGKGWCEDFFGISPDIKEKTLSITFRPLLNSHKSLNGTKIQLKLSEINVRGDRKAYANAETGGSSQIKDFFINKLYLTVENNLSDYFAFYKLDADDYLLFYVPELLYDNFIKLFKTDIPPINIEQVPKKISSNNISLQQIYYGAPGTGKSFTIDNLVINDNSIRTTFHPDTDYASFVGAYKPTMKDVPLSAFVGKEVHRALPQDGHPGTEQRIVYKFIPQAFLKAYVAAWSNLDTPYYLIIEEINRGNCAQIFGDLFQLLDRNNSGSSSYEINADEDIAKFLKEDENGFTFLSQEQKDAIANYVLEKDNGTKREIGEQILDGTILLLPHNLHIWATMNTSDQSLFPIDSAFKRRWNWKYVPIEYSPLDKRTQQPLDWTFEVAGNLYSWGKFLKLINPKIYSITASSDKQMGYFFAKADPSTGIISEDVFLNKVLFYLWTDVLKDYDVSEEPFVYENDNKVKTAFRFTDFFPGPKNANLIRFVNGLGLEAVNLMDKDGETSVKTGISVRVNGTKAWTITYAFFLILKAIAKDFTYDEIQSIVKENIKREQELIKTIPSADGYQKENGWFGEATLTSKDNKTFVVTNQWKKEFMPNIEALANAFNVAFEEV